MKKAIVLVSLLLAVVPSLAAYDLIDMLLSTPLFYKAAIPLGFIPSMISDPSRIWLGMAAIGVFTVPNTALIVSLFRDDEDAIAFWHQVVRITDGASFLAIAGYGAYLVLDPEDSAIRVLNGLLLLGISLSVGTLFGLDFIPFSMERSPEM